jgi:DNA polymerase-3 subunit gamma/tau
VASFCQGNITYQRVIDDLNVLDSEYYFRIVDYSLENKVSDIMLLLNDVINKGFDGGLLIQGLAKHVRNVLMAKDPQTLPLLEVSEQQRQRFEEQARRADTRFLYEALRLMNQCDINYRQSSNKRLLVELTLIEVAQVTQPDEGPASGRKPKRLKSLFKQLIQQARPQNAAPQVAAASHADSKENVRNGLNPQDAAAPRPGSRPTIKVGSLGTSWNNLRQQSRPTKMNILPGTESGGQRIETNQPFTQDDLELQWMSMCNRMPSHLVGIATRMKNMTPVITEMPAIELVVSNELIRDDIERIHGSIVKTLKMYLKNDAITLTVVVAEREEQTKILTRREQFEEMCHQNPLIEKLREAFDLELA